MRIAVYITSTVGLNLFGYTFDFERAIKQSLQGCVLDGMIQQSRKAVVSVYYVCQMIAVEQQNRKRPRITMGVIAGNVL